MTDDERKCSLFIRALSLLEVDDDGLTDACEFDDLQALAQAADEVAAITAAGASPYELALHRVAELTERVLMTWARPDPQAVREWLLARSELLQLRITTM